MPTTSQFVAELGHKIALSDSEIHYLESTGVNSPDSTFALLTNGVRDWAALNAWRGRAITEAIVPHLSPMLAEVARSTIRVTGAGAPSAKALNLKPTALLDLKVVPPELRLHGLPDRDLVSSAQYESWPAAEQGQLRPTCVAFAVVGCIELLRAGQGTAFRKLSPQYLYYKMRMHDWTSDMLPQDGWGEGATRLGQAKEVLASDGICSLQSCSYDTDVPTRVEGPAPSEKADAEAKHFRIMEAEYVSYRDPSKRKPGVARKLYDALGKSGPVAINVPIFRRSAGGNTFLNAMTKGSGIVENPDTTQIESGHAICVVGFQKAPVADERTGGWFIFRNSWGLDWPDNIEVDDQAPVPRVMHSGYGAISASYVEEHCWEMLSLKL